MENSITYKDYVYTLVDRTYHREESGGFEKWLIVINGTRIFFMADIRIPGLINSALQGMPDSREKVCVIDFFSEKDLGVLEPFEPTGEVGYGVKAVFSALEHLIINIIEPIRHFRYVAMVSKSSWKKIHDYYVNKLGSFAEDSIVKGSYDILNPGSQKEIDMGIFCLTVGDLQTNPDWRKNNSLK
jgi:hypothetical protein